MEYIKDNVKVSFEDIGEGINGFYNPDDPDDVALLRFDVYSLTSDGEWDAIDDASYCTNVPVSTDPEKVNQLLETIMCEVYDDVCAGISIKKKCEGLSWLSA